MSLHNPPHLYPTRFAQNTNGCITELPTITPEVSNSLYEIADWSGRFTVSEVAPPPEGRRSYWYIHTCIHTYIHTHYQPGSSGDPLEYGSNSYLSVSALSCHSHVYETVLCMHVCAYACLYVCAFMSLYVCACVCLCVCICAHTYVCVYVFACVRMRMFVCLYVCAYVCLCVCVFVCVLIRVCCVYVCAVTHCRWQ